MNIAILCGGKSTERNVSITGGKSVQEALITLGHNTILVDPAFGLDATNPTIFDSSNMSEEPTLEQINQLDIRAYLQCINSNIFDNIDFCFLLLHGTYGEDGIIQSLLQCRNIPYSGSGVTASALAFDKVKTKLICSANGILTPNWTVVHRKDLTLDNLGKEIRDALGKEVVIKPNTQGSTVGLSIIKSGNTIEIEEALHLAAKYADTILVEQYIDGREITVAVVGEEVMPIIEIETEDGFYDYNHKYSKGKTKYVCPADLSDDITEFTQNIAMTIFKTMGCEVFARIDFRVNHDGQPFLLEVNTLPGFTSQSLVPMAAKEIGIHFPELCQMIIDLSLEKNTNME